MERNLNAGMDAKLTAELKLEPRRSQIFVTVSMVGSIALAGFGCFLIYLEKSLWWAPFLFAGLIAAASVWAFGISHRNAEMHNPIASELTMSPDSVRLVTDPRLAEHSTFFSSMVDVFSALKSQKPLPSADALIDDKGQVIPGSAGDAKRATDAANSHAERLIRETAQSFDKMADPSPVLGQPVKASLDRFFDPGNINNDGRE